MRRTVVKFQCDNCNKELTRIKNGSDRDFPWDENWVELNQLEIGAPINASHRLVDQPNRIEMTDRDFCSKNCLLAFIDKQMQDAAVVRMPQRPLSRSEDEGEQLYPPPPKREVEPSARIREPQPPDYPQPRKFSRDHPHAEFMPEENFEDAPPQQEIIEEVREPKKKRGFF